MTDTDGSDWAPFSTKRGGIKFPTSPQSPEDYPPISTGGWCAPAETLYEPLAQINEAIKRVYYARVAAEERSEQMSKVDEVVATELQRRAEERELAFKMRLIDDYGDGSQYADGAVVKFYKSFSVGKDMAKEYTYAAIKVGGRWYVTGQAGQSSSSGDTWAQFVAWLVRGIPTEHITLLFERHEQLHAVRASAPVTFDEDENSPTPIRAPSGEIVGYRPRADEPPF